MIKALVSSITSSFLHTLSFHVQLRSTYNILSSKHQSLARLFGRKELKEKLRLVEFAYESIHDVEMVRRLFEITYDEFLDPGVLRVNQVKRDVPET